MFDTTGDRLLKTSKKVSRFAANEGVTLAEFSTFTTETALNRELASLGVDWAMYNPNEDFFIYVGILFRFKTAGELETNLIVQAFRSKPTQNQLIFFALFVLFYLYYLVKLLMELASTYNENKIRRDARNGV